MNIVFDPILHPESTRLEAWFATERAKGLVDFKVDLVRPLERTMEAIEALAGEINACLAAPVVPDTDLF